MNCVRLFIFTVILNYIDVCVVVFKENGLGQYSPLGNVAPIRGEKTESMSVPRSRVMLWRHAPELFKRLQKLFFIWPKKKREENNKKKKKKKNKTKVLQKMLAIMLFVVVFVLRQVFVFLENVKNSVVWKENKWKRCVQVKGRKTKKLRELKKKEETKFSSQEKQRDMVQKET